MPRRRRFLDRPHDHLLKAAAVHARIVAGEPHPDDPDAEQAEPAEPTEHQLRARAQERDTGGKFA